VSLTGNLESFPLAEVLRLGARTRQSGLLRVEAGGIHGRLFFIDGALTYGTTREEDDLGGELANAGLIDPHKWYPVERGEAPIESAMMEGREPADLHRHISDRLTDALIRLMRSKHGTFDFVEERAARYLTNQRIDVEECLVAAEVRVKEWAEVEAVIPNSWQHLELNPEPPAPQMTINGDTWRILAALNGKGSIEEVAERIGLSDFQAARAMAEMTKAGLLLLVEDTPSPAAFRSEDDGWEKPDSGLGQYEILSGPQPTVELLTGPGRDEFDN
jgi:hypothetical protein